MFTENKFAVIGGQHISKAVKLLYWEYRDKQYKPSDIPTAVSVVHAEVLQSATPVQLCRLAAGHHQKLQMQSVECSTEDICRHLARTMERKGYDPESGQPGLTEAELYVACETMGICKEDELPKNSKDSKKPLADQMVCLTNCV